LAKVRRPNPQFPADFLWGAATAALQVAQVPVIVTEHGINSANDNKRARLITTAPAELKMAMEEGVPVKGYMHWSLIDNFERIFGYKPQFGLHNLDRTSFARPPKPSATVLGDITAQFALVQRKPEVRSRESPNRTDRTTSLLRSKSKALD
jgi:beta-glucosidase